MIRAFLVAAAVALSCPAYAQVPEPAVAVQASEPLKARIAELPAVLKGQADYDAYFAPGFRAQVPKAQFDQISAGLIAQAGPLVGIESVTPTTPNSATVTLNFRDAVLTIQIAVAAAPPHQVEGLRMAGLTGREATVDAVIGTLKGLPGKTGFAFARLGDGAPTMLATHNPDTPFAIGSAFKLVILAELVRATNAGERKWTDMVTLDGTLLPAGAYMLSPKGTQASLYDIAAKMISVSDNSATDILLRHLGRARVEAMVPVVGIADPRGMRPFLSTMEMFKLKGIRQGALAAEWLAKDEAGRRAMLDGAIAVEHPMAIDAMLFRDGKPRMIDTLEWFASPADLVRVMDWLRRNTAPGSDGRKILSIDPGIPAAARAYRYTGFKGGSEPGVLNLTLLLEGKDGNWYALTASWNNPAAEVDLTRFFGLVGRAAELGAPKP